MANKSTFSNEGLILDYTPVAAVDAGNIINLGSLTGIAKADIAAGALGALALSGVVNGPYVGGLGNIGDDIYWDANGTPYGGAADGAYTRDAAAGDWRVGRLTKATAATDATCKFELNAANPTTATFTGKTSIATAIDLTAVAATHSGGIIRVTGANKTVTLPAGVAGMDYLIVNDTADGTSLLTVDLDGNEIIAGANLTIAATKTALNTAATAKRGDYLHLVCNVAATSWRCVAKRGIWVTSA